MSKGVAADELTETGNHACFLRPEAKADERELETWKSYLNIHRVEVLTHQQLINPVL